VAIASPAGTAPAITTPRATAQRGEQAQSVALSTWSWRICAVLLILGSAWPAPVGTISGLTITGDRVLGVLALLSLVVVALAGRLHWTPVHTALSAFVGVQLLTTAINAGTWVPGPKFVTIYVLGFACFALARECARERDGRRWLTGAWIMVAAALSVVGTVSAALSNLYQQPFWGSGGAQPLFTDTPYERILYGARATFNEWNLFSSFLLIPFSVILWSWDREGGRQWRRGVLVAMVFGLVNGITRAAWLSTAAIVALCWWQRRQRRQSVKALGVTLVSTVVLALAVQAASLGALPIWSRLFDHPSNLVHRMVINRVTLDSWLELPISGADARYLGSDRAIPGGPGVVSTTQNVLLGHGAGSVNRLSIVFPVAGWVHRIWNGNVVMFVLHDSGVLGLGALLSLVAVIVWRCRRARGSGTEDEAWQLLVPLLASGGALCFAYQFTHGLWLMYPYVFLGLLTAALQDACPSAPAGPASR
jgi:hypothetical protein